MEDYLFDLSIVLVGSAVLSFLAVFLKQPILIAYILCGVLFGPWGFGWVEHKEFIDVVSHLGITLLLFLAGLCLHPQKLIKLFRKTSIVTLTNCVASFVIAFVLSLAFGFELLDSTFIGLALMFSSTILVLKLIPTTTLHQQRMGAVCISVLILEDLLAVAVLALIKVLDSDQGIIAAFVLLIIKLALLLLILFLFEQFVLRRVMSKMERWHEAIFIVGLAWCFGIATISNKMGLFYEIGAFFAGVALARHPVSLYISEKLKPIRDFFLVLFFFTLGAELDLLVIGKVLTPALLLAATFLAVKPWLFRKMFIVIGEKPLFAKEIGLRLGQLSEFSLLIAMLAFSMKQVSLQAEQFIELVTIITIIVSSYLVVFKYPTPIGPSKKLIKD